MAGQLRVTPRQLRTLTARGCPVARRDGRAVLYSPLRVWPWYVAWKERELARRREPMTLSEAEDRKLAARARLAELDLYQRTGEMITLDAAEDRLRGMMDRLRSALIHIPGTLGPSLVGLRTPAEAEARLRPAIERAVRAMEEPVAEDAA